MNATGGAVCWSTVQLRDVVESRQTRNPAKDGAGEFLYVDIEALDNRSQRIVAPKRVANQSAPSRARLALRAGDVVFSLVRPYLKNIAIVPQELDGSVASTAYCVLRPKGGVDSRFLFYQLIQDRLINGVPTYGTSPPAARDEEFLDTGISLTTEAEQRRIADKLDQLFSDLDAGVAALERAKANLARYRAAVLKVAVEGKLTEQWRREHPDVEPASELLKRILTERRKGWEEEQLNRFEAEEKKPSRGWRDKYKEPSPPDTRNLPQLPNDWVWAGTEQLTAPGRSVMYGIIKPGPDTPGGVPYVRVMEMKTGTIDPAVLKRCHPDRAATFSRARLKGGDLLVSKDGTIGRVAIVPPELEGGNITQHVIRVSPSKHLEIRYLARAIEAPGCQAWMKGETKGVALQGVNVQDFRIMPIPLPPTNEQRAIADRLEMLISVADKAEDMISKALRRTAALRQTILRRAFAGRLVRRASEREPVQTRLPLTLA